METGATGSTQDVTRDATWTSNHPEVLESVGAGAFKWGGMRGETFLTATYSANSAVFHVQVLETGTFVVRGTISDGGIGLPGARVQISTGIGAGLSATTDTSGHYALYGVAGPVTLNATGAGYQAQAQPLDVRGDTTADFSLLAVGSPLDINGNWQLTFTASSACIDLPGDARVRTYPVSIQQTGSTVQAMLTLTSSTYPVPISARLLSQSLYFTFPSDSDGPWVFESLSGGQGFTLEGNALATYAAGRFDGLIDGRVHVYNTVTGAGTACAQPDHHWRLERKSGV